MIRPADINDAAAIARIYNYYVTETDISFETEPVSEDEMRSRITGISSRFPYIVYDNNGTVEGYCYAHPWKERAAYRLTLETTVYVDISKRGKGIGTQLMTQLIDECRRNGCHALVACITGSNAASLSLHRRLGFRQVSRFPEVGFKHGRFLDVIDCQLTLLSSHDPSFSSLA